MCVCVCVCVCVYCTLVMWNKLKLNLLMCDSGCITKTHIWLSMYFYRPKRIPNAFLADPCGRNLPPIYPIYIYGSHYLTHVGGTSLPYIQYTYMAVTIWPLWEEHPSHISNIHIWQSLFDPCGRNLPPIYPIYIYGSHYLTLVGGTSLPYIQYTYMAVTIWPMWEEPPSHISNIHIWQSLFDPCGRNLPPIYPIYIYGSHYLTLVGGTSLPYIQYTYMAVTIWPMWEEPPSHISNIHIWQSLFDPCGRNLPPIYPIYIYGSHYLTHVGSTSHISNIHIWQSLFDPCFRRIYMSTHFHIILILFY